MEPGNVAAEKPRDSGPGSEDVGDDLRAIDPLENEERIASLRGERREDRGDLLVRGDFVTYDQDVISVLRAVTLEEAMAVLVSRSAYLLTPA